jgi:hypothetical protein
MMSLGPYNRQNLRKLRFLMTDNSQGAAGEGALGWKAI